MMDYDIPFSWAEDKGYLKTSKLQKADHKTLTRYFVQMGLLVEKKVAFQIKDSHTGIAKACALLFDMWDDGAGNKFLGVYIEPDPRTSVTNS